MALTEELEAMQAAWADRDARQRQQDAEMKDMAFQMQQAQLFTSLATTRIKELNNELEPVRGARDEAQAQVASMEGVAQRQLERQAKVVSDNSNLQSRLDAANDELKQVGGWVQWVGGWVGGWVGCDQLLCEGADRLKHALLWTRNARLTGQPQASHPQTSQSHHS